MPCHQLCIYHTMTVHETGTWRWWWCGHGRRCSGCEICANYRNHRKTTITIDEHESIDNYRHLSQLPILIDASRCTSMCGKQPFELTEPPRLRHFPPPLPSPPPPWNRKVRMPTHDRRATMTAISMRRRRPRFDPQKGPQLHPAQTDRSACNSTGVEGRRSRAGVRRRRRGRGGRGGRDRGNEHQARYVAAERDC